MAGIRQSPSGIPLMSAVDDDLAPETSSLLKECDADALRKHLQAALVWALEKANHGIIGRLVEAGCDNPKLTLDDHSAPKDLAAAAVEAQNLLYAGNRDWVMISDEYTSRDITAITQVAGWLEQVQHALRKVPDGATVDEIPRKIHPLLDEIDWWTRTLNHHENDPKMTWMAPTPQGARVINLAIGDDPDPKVQLSW